jgi:hypothetical protein
MGARDDDMESAIPDEDLHEPAIRGNFYPDFTGLSP